MVERDELDEEEGGLGGEEERRGEDEVEGTELRAVEDDIELRVGHAERGCRLCYRSVGRAAIIEHYQPRGTAPAASGKCSVHICTSTLTGNDMSER